MYSTRIAAGVAALSLSLAACGGGGSSDTLSKSELIKKANAICEQASKDGKAIKQPSDITDASAAAPYFDKAAPIIDKETKDLKALKPAASVKADWDAFVAKQSAANDVLQTIKEKADKKDASGLQDLQKLGTMTDSITAAAKKVGATSCT